MWDLAVSHAVRDLGEGLIYIYIYSIHIVQLRCSCSSCENPLTYWLSEKRTAQHMRTLRLLCEMKEDQCMTSSGVQAFTRTVTARLSRHVVAVPPVNLSAHLTHWSHVVYLV